MTTPLWSLVCGHSSVSQMFCEDLCLLHSWVRDSRMSLKSNVMWFNARSRRSIEAPPVLLDAWLPSNKGCYSEVLAMGILLLLVAFSYFNSLQENGILFILNWLPSEEFTCGYSETSCTITPMLCGVCLGAIFESQSAVQIGEDG